MQERLLTKSGQLKRHLVSRGLQLFMPYEVKKETKPNLKEADDLLKDGFGLVGLVPHFSYGDFVRVLEALVIESGEVARRKMLIPVAATQQNFRGLHTFSDLTKIQIAHVSNPETDKLEAELKSQGKEIPWKKNGYDTSSRAYLSKALKVLENEGVVLLAPQGGRRPFLEPFNINALGFLKQFIERRKMEKVAFFPIGLEMVGKGDYSSLGGMHFGRKYRVAIGQMTRLSEVDGDINRWGFEKMYKLAPEAYRGPVF